VNGAHAVETSSSGRNWAERNGDTQNRKSTATTTAGDKVLVIETVDGLVLL
jgi:hypothetical protein